MPITSVMSFPSDADTHFELGKIYMQIENLALAQQHLKAALTHGTTNEAEAMDLCAELDKLINH